MAHSIQHMQSRRAEQWLTPSSTATATAGEQSNGSLHPAHAKPESRAMAHSIQHMQWLTPSSTCNGSLHPAQPQRAANHLHTSAYICCTLACFKYIHVHVQCVSKKLSIPLEINAISINIYTHFLFDYRHNSIVVVPTTGMV